MEIERKFLVAEITENLNRYPYNEIEQEYMLIFMKESVLILR